MTTTTENDYLKFLEAKIRFAHTFNRTIQEYITHCREKKQTYAEFQSSKDDSLATMSIAIAILDDSTRHGVRCGKLPIKDHITLQIAEFCLKMFDDTMEKEGLDLVSKDAEEQSSGKETYPARGN